MKTLFISLLLIFVSYSNIYSQEGLSGCLLPSREVANIAVKFWQNNYAQLRADSIIGQNRNFDRVQFSHSDLKSFREGHGDSLYNRIAVFKYYYDNDLVPKIAIGNMGDTTAYLLDNNVVVTIDSTEEFRELQRKFRNWETFFEKNEDFVYVKEYYYCWFLILNEIPKTGELDIENIAHTISALDSRYDYPRDVILEGHVVFDLIIGGYSVHEKESFIDFAVPCPKNCFVSNPQNINIE